MRLHQPLLQSMHPDMIEAGCDEAGRGCLAGPVFAAAVVLPSDFECDELNDSKQLSEKQRNRLRPLIEEQALSFAVAMCSNAEIDELNILWASVEAMHRALSKLVIMPQHILVDGNRFRNYEQIPHTCVVGGDAVYLSIAAASVLAKTYRDEYMTNLAREFPRYDWDCNKGYPTKAHREAIRKYGITPYHRKSFRLLERQLDIDFGQYP
ncbi:MAG TPA: ribonuclease HII [Dysgonamonadaceae bacterium]|nr:ribonuclease HII [Dysgonamonadaceae bacterium]HQG07399.1 ribonuclease HII [Dysgonamonadaceae bacterium]HQI43163.1 ribonuclease HII [Dysgonamonadaceae bacterium]